MQTNYVTQHVSVPFLWFFFYVPWRWVFLCLRFSGTSQISLDSPVAQPSWRALWWLVPRRQHNNAVPEYRGPAGNRTLLHRRLSSLFSSLPPPVSPANARRSSTVGATILVWIPRAFFRRTGFLNAHASSAGVHRAVAARRIVRIRM